jgi:hypothetical protein
MALVDQIISAESGGNPNARNPHSSAGGAGQFINSTFLSMIRKHRPDLAEGKSDADILALKFDPGISRDMTAAYAADNAGILSKAGLPVTPGSTYLAHFAGPQGAVGILNADPSMPVSAVLTPAAVKANPFLNGMTAADLRAWAEKKVGGNSAPISAQSAPFSMAGQTAASPSPSATPEDAHQPDNSAQALATIMASMSKPQDQAPMLLPMRQAPQLAMNFNKRSLRG